MCEVLADNQVYSKMFGDKLKTDKFFQTTNFVKTSC